MKFVNQVSVRNALTGVHMYSLDREDAISMVMGAVAVRVDKRTIRIVIQPQLTAGMEHPMRHSHGPQHRRADSSHGDAGRVDVVRGNKTISIPNGRRVIAAVPGLSGLHRRREVY